MTEENENLSGAKAEGKQSGKKSFLTSFLIKVSVFLLVCLISVGGYIIYRLYTQVSMMREAMTQIMEPVEPAVQKRSKFQPLFSSSGQQITSSNRILIKKSTSFVYPVGSLRGGDIIESVQRVDSQKLSSAMKKYANRPIVQEIINDLKKDPNFKKAFAKGSASNPMEVLKVIKSMNGMKKIASKYALRPEFMKLILEVMQDPEMRPLFQMSGDVARKMNVIPFEKIQANTSTFLSN